MCELFKKRSYNMKWEEILRDLVQRFMERWKRLTIKVNKNIHSTTTMYSSVSLSGTVCKFFLFPAETDLITISNGNLIIIEENKEGKRWWDILEMEELRFFVEHLPNAISEIIEKMGYTIETNSRPLSFMTDLLSVEE